MRTLLVLALAMICGSGMGAAMAYWSVGPLKGDQLSRPSAPVEGPAAAVGPRAEVDQAVFKFGAMQRGETRSHRFVVRNTGDAPLVLTPGQTSCKCTGFTAGEGPVPPGGEAEVELQWQTKTPAGMFRQTANLITNDPVQPSVILTVEGEVLSATDLSPPEFLLGRMSVDQTSEASVVVMSFKRDDLEVTAEPPPQIDAYRVVVAPVNPADLPDPRAKSGTRVTLLAGPGLPLGVLDDWVTLRTNLPDFPPREVPIVGRVEGDLTVRGPDWNPETGVLSLGFVKSETGRKFRMRVFVKGPHAADATLAADQIDPPELRVTFGQRRPVRDGVHQIPVTIEVPPGTRPMVRLNNGLRSDGSYQFPEGRIRLTSNLPSTPVFDLRVRLAVVGGS